MLWEKKKKENEKKERKVDDTVGAYVEYENFVSQKLQRWILSVVYHNVCITLV